MTSPREAAANAGHIVSSRTIVRVKIDVLLEVQSHHSDPRLLAEEYLV